MNKLLSILLFFVCLPAVCQDRKALQGRVVTGDLAVPDVYVINKATALETKTDAQGNFTIQAKAGDLLVVYSTKTQVRQFAVSEASFAEVPYVVSVNYNAYELEEVVVEGSTINSVSLGIVPKDQKQYTAAEKKLFTAEDGTDAIFNAISGRSKMLKKAVETEKKAGVIEYLNGLYTDEEIIEEFKIPAENVQGFLFYAAENKNIIETIKGDNPSLVKLKLIDISIQYLASLKQ